MPRKYFAYDGINDEFDTFNTLEQAKSDAEFYMKYAEEEFEDGNGWPDGTCNICYGEIGGRSVDIHDRPDFFNYILKEL